MRVASVHRKLETDREHRPTSNHQSGIPSLLALLLAQRDRLLLELVKGMLALLVWIDGEDHALVALVDGLGLARVEPDRVLVVPDGEAEDGLVGAVLGLCREVESRVEAGGGAALGAEGGAGVRERRLGEGVVAWVELKPVTAWGEFE